MKMRPSRVLTRLRSGGIASCIKLNLADPRVAEIAAMSGIDCIWTDREHVPNTLQDIAQQVRAAKAHDVDTMVRVSRGSYSEMIWPLEMDAAGIMVPHVMSAADSRQIAWQTRFHPIGRRPLDGGNADGAYCGMPLEDYLRDANEQRFVCIQIEDPEPEEELEEIARTPGIDLLFFGPADYSHGIGAAGDFAHPRVTELRKRIPQLASKYGKFAGTVTSIAGLPETIALGYRFISVGADVTALSQAFAAIAGAFGESAARLASENGTETGA